MGRWRDDVSEALAGFPISARERKDADEYAMLVEALGAEHLPKGRLKSISSRRSPALSGADGVFDVNRRGLRLTIGFQPGPRPPQPSKRQTDKVSNSCCVGGARTGGSAITYAIWTRPESAARLQLALGRRRAVAEKLCPGFRYLRYRKRGGRRGFSSQIGPFETLGMTTPSPFQFAVVLVGSPILPKLASIESRLEHWKSER